MRSSGIQDKEIPEGIAQSLCKNHVRGVERKVVPSEDAFFSKSMTPPAGRRGVGGNHMNNGRIHD